MSGQRARRGSQKNIVFLSKKIAGNSRMIDAVS
jgi:hypothetical protein